jgi:hypothetical protein
VCDLAYVVLLEQVDRQCQADMNTAAVLIAAGAKGVDMPNLVDARTWFDQALVAEPPRMDRRTSILRRALGLDA